jgi:hypothetical protein
VAKRSLTIEEVLALLAAAPPRIAELTAGLTPAHLHTPPAPGEWSANDVLAHLRACADVWGNYIRTMFAQDRPTIRTVSPRTWIRKTNYPEQEFQPSLQAYTTQRADLLALLEPLPPQDWYRAATMTGAGKPLEQTIHSYAESIALHERPHIKQIARITNSLRR